MSEPMRKLLEVAVEVDASGRAQPRAREVSQGGQAMKLQLAWLRLPVLISSAFVLALVLLESISHAASRRLTGDVRTALDAIVVFGMLWTVTLALTTSLTILVNAARSSGGRIAKPIGMLIGMLIGALGVPVIAAVWWSLLIDQIPCFLGAVNCD